MGQAGVLTHDKCSAMMRNRQHKFYSLWASIGWKVRTLGQPGCWDVGWTKDWFSWGLAPAP